MAKTMMASADGPLLTQGFLAGEVKAAVGRFGAGGQQLGVGAYLGFRDRDRQRRAGRFGALGAGAEGQEVAEYELPPAPNAADTEQAGALHQGGLAARDGGVVGGGFEQAGFAHAGDRVGGGVWAQAQPSVDGVGHGGSLARGGEVDKGGASRRRRAAFWCKG